MAKAFLIQVSGTNKHLKQAQEAVDALTIAELELLMPYIETVLARKNLELEEAWRKIEELGYMKLADPPAPGRRIKPSVKYRSRRDPTLTWAGRGRLAHWLRDEMLETGLPQDAFRVDPPSD